MGLKRPGINHDFVLSESMFSFFRKNPKSHSQIPPDLPEPTTPTSPTSPTLFGSTRGVGSQKWETLDQIKLLILQNKDVLGNSEIEFMKRLLQLQQLAPASGKLAKRRKMKEKTFLDQVNTLCDDVKKALPNRSVDSLVGEKPRQQLPGSHNEVRSWAPHGQHTTGPSRVQDNVSLTSSYVNVSVEDTQSSSFTRQEGQKPINPPPGPDHHEGSKEPPKSHKDYSRAKSPLLIEEANQVLSRQDRTNKRREDDKRVEGSWHPGRRSGERLESNENRSKSVARDQSRPHHHRYYSEKIEYQRDRERDWGRDRDKVKEKDRDRERDRYRERDREREKERYNYKRHGEIRNQYGSRERKERDGYEVGERARDVEREKDIDSGKDEKHVEGRNREKEPYDEKSRDRSKYDERGKDRERDRKYDKEWSDRKDRDRDRERERERDRGRERDREREEREKYRERDRERYDKERERYTDRDKDKDKDRQKDRDRRDGRDRMDNFTRPRHKSVPPERSARIDGNRNDTNQDTPPITNNLDLEPPSKDPIPRFVYPDDPLPPPQPRLQRKPTTGVPHIPTIVAYPDSDGEGEPGIRTRTSVVGERPRGVRRAQTQIRASGKAEAKQYARPMYKKFMSGPAPGSEPHEQVQGIPKNPLPPRVMVTPPSHPGLANQYQKHHKEQLPPSRFHEVFSPDVASAAVIHLPPSSEAS